MIDNMEGDIVSYYKKIIMKNILSNISIIEDKVEKEIKKAIFGDDAIKKVKKLKKEKSLITENVIDSSKVIIKESLIIKENNDKPQKRIIPNVPKEDRSQISEGVPTKPKRRIRTTEVEK